MALISSFHRQRAACGALHQQSRAQRCVDAGAVQPGSRQLAGAAAGAVSPRALPATRAGRPRCCRCVATQSQQQQQSAADAAASRRAVLAALPAVLAPLALAGGAAAAGAPACEFTTAPSGLQFCDVRVGDGPEPAKGSLIRCHYTGRLASNNAVFDSSYERGRPLTFKVGVREVISGWDQGIGGAEGVPPMKEGGKRVLLIPSELAYGARGAGGGIIPPNAALLFEVELLGKPGRR